jgi:hypothetical protein
VPTRAPELLARTHYGLGSGVSAMGTLPDLYAEWERRAADVTESHRTYLPRVYFRCAPLPDVVARAVWLSPPKTSIRVASSRWQ